jgi:hypothetical protein
MKDARGHGSDPRGGLAAHQSGVAKATREKMPWRSYDKDQKEAGRINKEDPFGGEKEWKLYKKQRREEAQRQSAAAQAKAKALGLEVWEMQARERGR